MTTGFKVMFILMVIVLGMSMFAVAEGNEVYNDCHNQIGTIMLEEMADYPMVMADKKMVMDMFFRAMDDEDGYSILETCKFLTMFPEFEVDFRSVLKGSFAQIEASMRGY